jgi:colanic acid/amylovoran biosynthesis glycosyltransferase
LVDKKGFQFAIRAVAKIISRFPDVLYEIAGEGTLRPMLQQLIDDLGVGENVKLLGAQTRDEVLHHLQQASIFLAPCVTSDGKTDGWLGDVETGPVVIMEAMASGLPVISTRHTGIPEFLHDGESGFLLEERDADGIADRLIRLMNQPETRREMGEKGRNWVHEYHNTEKQNDRLVEVYRLLLQGGSPARFPNPQRHMEPIAQEAPLDDNQVSQLAASLGRWNSGLGSRH